MPACTGGRRRSTSDARTTAAKDNEGNPDIGVMTEIASTDARMNSGFVHSSPPPPL